jgi:hypothetical protein
MTVIALPSGHDHLADALVRDLGFDKMHVDDPVREAALRIDPIVEGQPQLANVGGRSPRLSARLGVAGGDWDKAIKKCPEIARFLEALRAEMGDEWLIEPPTDTVLTGVSTWTVDDRLSFGILPGASGRQFVAIEGRVGPDAGVDHFIPEGGVVDQERAIVAYVQSLRAPKAKAKEPVAASTE